MRLASTMFTVPGALRSRLAIPMLGVVAALLVTGCGGGGSSDPGSVSPPPSTGGGSGGSVTGAAAAAVATANSTSNDCNAVRPFYWEVGDAGGALVSGSVESHADPTVYTAGTRLSVA